MALYLKVISLHWVLPAVAVSALLASLELVTLTFPSFGPAAFTTVALAMVSPLVAVVAAHHFLGRADVPPADTGVRNVQALTLATHTLLLACGSVLAWWAGGGGGGHQALVYFRNYCLFLGITLIAQSFVQRSFAAVPAALYLFLGALFGVLPEGRIRFWAVGLERTGSGISVAAGAGFLVVAAAFAWSLRGRRRA